MLNRAASPPCIPAPNPPAFASRPPWPVAVPSSLLPPFPSLRFAPPFPSLPPPTAPRRFPPLILPSRLRARGRSLLPSPSLPLPSLRPSLPPPFPLPPPAPAPRALNPAPSSPTVPQRFPNCKKFPFVPPRSFLAARFFVGSFLASSSPLVWVPLLYFLLLGCPLSLSFLGGGWPLPLTLRAAMKSRDVQEVSARLGGVLYKTMQISNPLHPALRAAHIHLPTSPCGVCSTALNLRYHKGLTA